MRKLIAYFIKYPIYANAIIIITAIAGILSLAIMPKSFFPELSPGEGESFREKRKSILPS